MRMSGIERPPNVIPSRARVDGYPFDFDASLRHGRPQTGWDIRPYPPISGAMSPFLNMQDDWTLGTSSAKRPFGPGVTTIPVNLQNQMIVPGLAKTGYR